MSKNGNQNPAAVAAAIMERKTLKVLGSTSDLAQISPESAAKNNKIVLDSLKVAGWAPFHYARGVDDLAEPWRAHVLWHKESQSLAPKLSEWFQGMSPSNKLSKMMQACGALVLVTWLPQFYGAEEKTEKQFSMDEEHLMAASAMVQNLLVLLTAHGMGTYWSSGGKLGSDFFFEQLGIPTSERLVAAVFVEYPDTLEDDRERIPGKHRESRSNEWIKQISLT
ncbi:MAG: nitroreductase family protein [Chloroflexota bacterium]